MGCNKAIGSIARVARARVSLVGRFDEPVTDALHGLDLGPGTAELLSQAADIHVEGPRLISPELGDQRVSCDQPIRLREQEGEQERLKIFQSDVRHKKLPKVDILCAFNFSFFVF